MLFAFFFVRSLLLLLWIDSDEKGQSHTDIGRKRPRNDGDKLLKHILQPEVMTIFFPIIIIIAINRCYFIIIINIHNNNCSNKSFTFIDTTTTKQVIGNSKSSTSTSTTATNKSNESIEIETTTTYNNTSTSYNRYKSTLDNQ